MRHFHSVIWALIAVCFLALVGCAHATDRTPATADDLKSGTTTSDDVNPWNSNILERNHGGGRQMRNDALPATLPQLQMPALRQPASPPLLAALAPVVSTSALANVQPSWGWFVFGVAFLFALIYAVRRSNALPDDEKPQIKG